VRPARVRVLAALASLTAAIPAHADEPDTDVTKATERRASSAAAFVGAGAAVGRFVGLPYRALSLEVGGSERLGAVRGAANAELELGSTEHGLSIYRGAFGAGLESAGRLRVGAGPRLSYTMVLRATKDPAFFPALFGDIGGFGIGGQAWMSVDIIQVDRVALGLSLRGSADVYDGGTSLRGCALIHVVF